MSVFSPPITALQMLTRLPTPSLTAAPPPATIAASSIFYPAVGALLGLLGWAVLSLVQSVLPSTIAAGFALLVLTLATGALHEDGLADSADAFGSQWTIADRLRVMKDSRIGTYGAAALILAYGLRWQALALVGGAPLFVAQVLSKLSIVGLAAAGSPVGEGSGGTFARAVQGKHFAAASLVSVALLVLLASPALVSSFAAVAFVSLLAHLYFRSNLNGVTGDCLGAAAVVNETVVLLVYVGAAS